jgi:mannose-6-phosphate isomerase-like protein (cupin superfamily)
MSNIDLTVEPVIVANAPLPTRSPDGPASFYSLDELHWRRIIPAMGEGSPKLAVVHHDVSTAATAMLIWTPPNFHVPRHWHSGGEKHMLVRGTFIMECEGRRVVMTPGTFNYLPARTVHQAWTPADSDCLLFTDVDTLWDINWVDPPPGVQEARP